MKQSNVWYNKDVGDNFEKKEEPLALRIPISLKNRLIAIGFEHDRPVGYVARELMIRGLAMYEQDGKIRDSVLASEQSVNDKPVMVETKVRRVPLAGTVNESPTNVKKTKAR